MSNKIQFRGRFDVESGSQRSVVGLTCGLVCALLIVSDGSAAVIVHDNTAATFVWTANGGAGLANSLFDPTLSPDDQQSDSFTPRQLQHNVSLGGSSTFIGRESIGGGANITIARETVPVVVEPPSGGVARSFRPATVFVSLSEVTANANFESNVDVGYYNVGLGRNNFLGQHPFIGFRVRLDDGLFHFGWIELDYRVGQTAGGVTLTFYQPVRWAYETLPNTPITVPAAPAAVLLAAAGSATLRRSRRGT